MPTTSHIALAVALLKDAAGFFRNVGEQNRPLKHKLFDNADVYDKVADLLDEDPTGLVELEED